MRSALDLLRRYQQALRELSADDLADLYAPDAVHELPFRFPGMPDRLTGREQVRTAYRAAWSASQARVAEVRDVAVHLTADPDVVIAEQVVAGTLAATGEPFDFPGVLVLTARGGEITHVRDYMDALAVIETTQRVHRSDGGSRRA